MKPGSCKAPMCTYPSCTCGVGLAVSNDSLRVVALPGANERFACAKHGITTAPPERGLMSSGISRTPHIEVACGPASIQGNYCLICYAEWIAANFPRLERVAS